VLFNTYQFTVVFAPLALLAFYLLRRFAPPSAALGSVVVASLVFYAWWRPDYVPVLVASIIINYAIGTLIIRSGSRVWLGFGVALNLGFLGYYKYASFAVAQTNAMLGFSFADPAVVLPLAVSFYTFQQIAYVVDCYRGKIHDNNFLRYAFTVTFFPHLVAGPIVRMQEISHQFSDAFKKPAINNLCIGLALFAIGLGKKVLIADYFGSIADPLFASAASGQIEFIGAWKAALSYTLQLYFDFSGYSDMAIGLARMFGFRLAVNFLSPYQSTSIADFWRRWHITLSRFLRDYLYIPLGGSRRGPLRNYLNLVITMLLGGLWHGAAWTFVAWGLYHGLMLATHRAWQSVRPDWLKTSPWYVAASAALTFLCVVIGWVLFKSPDFKTAWLILSAMAQPSEFSMQGQTDILMIEISLLFCWIAPNVYQMLYRYRPVLLLREQIPLLRTRAVAYAFNFRTAEAVVLSCVLIASLYEMHGTVSTFLYFMF
jgi:D-alanyl-lipoteichoic acid acyltransferase DltB (MBOAT superfamily)